MVNTKHKDRLFGFLFGRTENRAWTLDLYNAMNGTDYVDPEEIEITTIEDVVYMGRKNDVSFIIRGMMNLYEHQATPNPNMPLRQLMYVSNLYEKFLRKHHLNRYSDQLIPLPVPKLVVFYNGTAEMEDEQILRLCDAFPPEFREDVSDIEVRVRMLNINTGRNQALMDACKPLAEYVWFVGAIRKNRAEMELGRAVDRAVADMPDDYQLKAFMKVHKAEVSDMLLTDYDEAETMEMFHQEWRAEGREDINRLYRKLMEENRMDDLHRAVMDSEYQAQLLEQYGKKP